MQEINFSPITQFARLVRAAEFSNQKEVKMSIQQARLLNLTLVEIMDELIKKVKTTANKPQETVKINMDGGSFG